jgi:hypothetical protein
LVGLLSGMLAEEEMVVSFVSGAEEAIPPLPDTSLHKEPANGLLKKRTTNKMSTVVCFILCGGKISTHWLRNYLLPWLISQSTASQRLRIGICRPSFSRRSAVRSYLALSATETVIISRPKCAHITFWLESQNVLQHASRVTFRCAFVADSRLRAAEKCPDYEDGCRHSEGFAEHRPRVHTCRGKVEN